VARLARDRMPLTVCPLSNLRLQVVPDLTRHPLRRMNGQRPDGHGEFRRSGLFRRYVNDNYRAVQQSLGLNRQDIVALARNGFEASMMSESDRRQALGPSIVQQPVTRDPERSRVTNALERDGHHLTVAGESNYSSARVCD